jgi:hypothetical protein
MSSFERNKLLTDTLRESAEYERFREAIFKNGLAEIRKKRAPARLRRQWAVAASIMFGIGLGLWQATRRSEPPPAPVARARSVNSFVSRPLDLANVVHSTADDRLFVQTPHGNTTVEVVTKSRVPLIELNDRDLLATFANKPAGFVQNSGHTEFILLEN